MNVHSSWCWILIKLCLFFFLIRLTDYKICNWLPSFWQINRLTGWWLPSLLNTQKTRIEADNHNFQCGTSLNSNFPGVVSLTLTPSLTLPAPKNNKIKLGDTLPCIILSELEFTTKFNFVTWTNSACLAMESLSTSNRNGTTKTDNFSKPRPSTASAGDWQVNTPGHPHWPLYLIHNVYG